MLSTFGIDVIYMLCSLTSQQMLAICVSALKVIGKTVHLPGNDNC